jgi:D-inositol-3-phosphate glycosyltransferase
MAKRIALISDHASPLAAAGGVDSGGQNIYVAQVACNLAQLGYEVDVFTRRDSPELPLLMQWKPSVRIVHVPAGPAAYLRKEELLPTMAEFSEYTIDFARSTGGYDLVHANFFMSGLVALELKRALDIPFAVTFHALGRVRRLHQGDCDQFPLERLEIEEETIDQADAIIAECPQDRIDLTTLYRADPARISIVPCGFDKTEFWPIASSFARRALGFAPEEHILLNIGRLIPRKGLDNIIRALALLGRDYGFQPQLVIVGGNSDVPDPTLTPEIGRLRALAREQGVLEQVLFTGRRSREFLKLYYSAADLFITTPWYEPFGITPLEAMACGTPVVGSNVGGIRYSVVDGVTGSLVPPNDADSLAVSIARLLQDKRQLELLRQNGLRRVRTHFTWQRVTRSLSTVFEQVMAASSAPARARRAADIAVAA